MRKHLGKARYPAITLLAVTAILLFLRLIATNDDGRRAAAMLPDPTANDVVEGLIRAGLEPEGLAAAGLAGAAVNAVIINAQQYLIDHQVDLDLADASLAQARQQSDGLRRAIQSGTATEEQINAYPAAEASLALAQSQRHNALDGIFNAASAALPPNQRATLAAIRTNRWWDLPVEFLVLDRPEPQWVQLRDALANERISADLEEPPDPEAQAWLSQCRSAPLVAAARANLDANLATVNAAWNQAAGPAPP
jgi:hypothetical protein